MARRPRIGITLELADPLISEVDARVREVVERSGGIAVVVPHSSDPDTHAHAFPLLDGVILMGGPDVAPEHYGAEPHHTSEPGHDGFDVTDLGLARACLETGTPLLGICRGNQVINVAAGGTLLQDVPSLVDGAVGHSADWRTVRDRPPGSRHTVTLAPDSRLAGWLDTTVIEVNSYHHQSIDEVGDGLRAVAWAPDGVIEAVESRNGRFVIGMQWHNEFHMRDHERFARPLEELVAAAASTAR
jgi:putative glutamine amidotransferase